VPLPDLPLENLNEDLEHCLRHVSFVFAFAMFLFCVFLIIIYICIFPIVVLIDFLFPRCLHYL
jgi:hypothetical protein